MILSTHIFRDDSGYLNGDINEYVTYLIRRALAYYRLNFYLT